ncbi:unnamed protein product [Brassica oleracea var. botrytis]
MHLLKASSIYSLSRFDMTRCNQNFRHVHHSYRVIKYHFSGPFILVTSDMVEEVYVTAEGTSGDMYAEPSARKSGHRFANKRTVESCFHQQLTLTCR